MIDERFILQTLDGVLTKESITYDKPTRNDWRRLETKFNCDFPQTFVLFMDAMSVYSFPGDILNVTSIGHTNGNDTIAFVYDVEIENEQWFEGFIPFYGVGNGDYFGFMSLECPNSKVYYYSHETVTLSVEYDDFEGWVIGLPLFLQ